MPEWFAHSSAHPVRNQLPPTDVKNRMPEKQPDPADPPAKPIPERHPSFLLHDLQNLLHRLLNRVARRIEHHGVACAGGSGAIIALRVLLVPLFHLVQEPARSCVLSPFACNSSKRRRARSSGEAVRKIFTSARRQNDRPDVAPVHDDVVLPRELPLHVEQDIPARTAAPTRPRHSGYISGVRSSAVTSMPLKIMCCTPSA